MKKTFALLVQNLRNYIPVNVFRGGQETVYTKILDAIIKGVRTMYIEGPTGMGKSFIQSTLADAIINGSNIKILLLVPKITLLSQMRREFVKFAKHLHLALFGGGQKMHGNQVTIMTYQSFMRVQNQVLKQYTVIFLDEAHKSLGDQTKAKVKQQKHAIVIGFTATSSYSEKKNLKEFLKYEAYRISIPEAVRVGMLSAIQFIIGKVQIEISGKQVTESTKEYTERLGKDIIREGGNIAAAKLYKKLFEKRGTRFIMFTASVAQGYDLVRELHEQGVAADIITGQMKFEDRETLFERFRKNKFKVLVGIDVIKEGFDDPGVHGVMFVYPVGSKVDLVQGAGRATRIDELAPNKVAYVVQLMFEGKNQVWYNDALEGTGPFVIPDQNYQSKMKRGYDVVTTKELLNISDDIIESVSVDHEEVLNLIRNYNTVYFFDKLSGVEKIDIAKVELAKHGIISRALLINERPSSFKEFNFGNYGGIYSFCSMILGRTVRIVTTELLTELADKLWPVTEEEQLEIYRQELKIHEIDSHVSLIATGSVIFNSLDFGYGKGISFYSRVFKRSVDKIGGENLTELANKLWPCSKDELLELYRGVLKNYSIHSREDLLQKGIVAFANLNLGIYGKGIAFCSRVLKKKVKKPSVPVLIELADTLWPIPIITKGEQLELYREALRKHGIDSRERLLGQQVSPFREFTFGNYGSASSFCSQALEKKQRVGSQTITQLANLLWPDDSTLDEQNEWYRQALKLNGIRSREELLLTKAHLFRKLVFEGYGSSRLFCEKALGKNLTNVNIPEMTELADLLWPTTKEDQLNMYRKELKKNKIDSRISLLRVGSKSFKELDFGIYGKGMSFSSKLLGKFVRPISAQTLIEIADLLWPITDEERFDLYRQTLGRYSVNSKDDLLNLGVELFNQLDFDGSKARVFYKKIIGKPSVSIGSKEIKEIADVLWPVTK